MRLSRQIRLEDGRHHAQSNISHAATRLVNVGLLRKEKRGKEVYLYITDNAQTIKDLLDTWLTELENTINGKKTDMHTI